MLTNCCELPAAHPNANIFGDLGGRQASANEPRIGTEPHDSPLKRVNEAANSAAREEMLQLEDRIGHQLARPVERQETAAVNAVEVGAERREAAHARFGGIVGGVSGPQASRENRSMLEQQQALS